MKQTNTKLMQACYDQLPSKTKQLLLGVGGLPKEAHPYIEAYELKHLFDASNSPTVKIDVTCVSGLVISSKARHTGKTGATYWAAVRACRDEVNSKLVTAVSFLNYQLDFLDSHKGD